MLPASPPIYRYYAADRFAAQGLAVQSAEQCTIITSRRVSASGASGMLGAARLLGQSTGAALVALMLNQFGDSGTRIFRCSRRRHGDSRGGSERFCVMRNHAFGRKKRTNSTRFSSPVGAVARVLTRYVALQCVYQRWVRHKPALNDFDFALCETPSC